MKLLEILTTLFLSLTLVSCSSPVDPHEVAVPNVLAQTSYSPLPSSELYSLLKDAVSKDDPIQIHILLENHVPLSQNLDKTLQQTVNNSFTGTNIPSNPNEFDINSIIFQYGTLLHWAACHGHSDLVPVLLIRGADINSKCGKLTMTPLMLAARKGYAAVIVQLLDALATHPELIHSLIITKDNEGWTALHHAAFANHEAVVAQLLDALATHPERMHSLITTQDNEGETALHHAAFNGHEAAVAQLLDALATHPELIHSLIITKDDEGWTALHHAAFADHEAVVAQLLDALATHPELSHSLIIRTALHLAARLDHDAIVALLLRWS